MPLSEFRRGYLLFEAFEALGRRLYGHMWTGEELSTITVPDAHDAAAKAALLKDQKASIEEEITTIEALIRRTVTEAEIALLKERLAQAKNNRGELGHLLFQAEPTDTHWESYRANNRRDHVLEVLVSALAQRRLEGSAVGGFVIPDHFWSGQAPHFWFDVPLSMARVPKTFSSRRRFLLTIPEDQFDAWLAGILPSVISENTEVSPELLCENFLARFVDEAPGRRQPMAKIGIYKKARSEIPQLSRRQFDRVWARITPWSWQKRGRRAWN